ncbi:MAG: hypothetical protein Fur0018_07320 [Anaerolineales bacterium]
MLLGAALGWGAARLAPPQYRSAAELYVGLHAYRAPEESNRNPSSYYDFRNLDDFKNWQLEQLDQFVRRDAIVAETLRRLQAQDAAWAAVTAADLQAMLSPQWRTVGKWRLTVTAPAAHMAEQAAETWRAVSLEALQEALNAAAEVMRLDVEMQAVAGAQADLTRRAALLEAARAGLDACLTSLPADKPLSEAERWQLQALAAQASDFTPAWQSLLADFPPPDAPGSAAMAWCQAALAAVTQAQSALPQAQVALQARFDALDEAYAAANAASYGLSRNLSLDGVASAAVRAQSQRDAGGWILLGAFLGVLVALIGWLAALGVEERNG